MVKPYMVTFFDWLLSIRNLVTVVLTSVCLSGSNRLTRRFVNAVGENP